MTLVKSAILCSAAFVGLAGCASDYDVGYYRSSYPDYYFTGQTVYDRTYFNHHPSYWDRSYYNNAAYRDTLRRQQIYRDNLQREQIRRNHQSNLQLQRDLAAQRAAERRQNQKKN